MSEELRGFRTSSARRREASGLWIVAAVVVVLLAIVLAVLQETDESPPKPPTSIPQPSSTQTTEPTPTTTVTVLVEESSDWVVIEAPTPTPTPWPTPRATRTRAPRPEPSPTPLLSECVNFRWSARQVFSPSAQVMIEIDISNRCSRNLGPLDLWFEITGWRDGGEVQSVRGHPFDFIRRGRGGIATIGLPGSIDWYDEITVEVVD